MVAGCGVTPARKEDIFPGADSMSCECNQKTGVLPFSLVGQYFREVIRILIWMLSYLHRIFSVIFDCGPMTHLKAAIKL